MRKVITLCGNYYIMRKWLRYAASHACMHACMYVDMREKFGCFDFLSWFSDWSDYAGTIDCCRHVANRCRDLDGGGSEARASRQGPDVGERAGVEGRQGRDGVQEADTRPLPGEPIQPPFAQVLLRRSTSRPLVRHRIRLRYCKCKLRTFAGSTWI